MIFATKLSEAEQLKNMIENNYSWDLTDFEKLVRNEWERLVAQAIISQHPTDDAEYMEIVEWEQESRAAEETLKECDETEHELAKTLTPEQVKEAKLSAKFIYEML